MLTLSLQTLISVLALAIGVECLRIGRGAAPGDVRATAWLHCGIAFTAGAAIGLVQDAGAAWAYVAGPESAVYREYLLWSRVGNYSRSLLRVALAGVLVALARGRLVSRRRGTVAYLAAVALGAVPTLFEGGYDFAEHVQTRVVLDVVELVAILVALLAALRAQSMDLWLWAALTVYGVRQAMIVLWYSAQAWREVPGTWLPSYRQWLVLAALFYVGMLAIALRRRAAERRRLPIRGVLELSP